ncbi:hypothetical protein [Algivirga pacifica]|uniref:DUF2383 domain-containing protein n=1 Tax=Algivirga pacifica TaxID=1162670 RepID=A0ABP9D046_9BACT
MVQALIIEIQKTRELFLEQYAEVMDEWMETFMEHPELQEKLTDRLNHLKQSEINCWKKVEQWGNNLPVFSPYQEGETTQAMLERMKQKAKQEEDNEKALEEGKQYLEELNALFLPLKEIMSEVQKIKAALRLQALKDKLKNEE